MPGHRQAGPLQGIEIVEPFTHITRSQHMDDFLSCWTKRAMVPHRIRSTVRNFDYGLQVLWFAPSKPETENNFYGNVSFKISFDEIISRYGRQFYYVDRADYNTHIVTRIVLTNRRLNLDKVDCNSADSPLQRDASGNWSHAKACRSMYNELPHELEIALDATPEDCAWVFKNCNILINNHSDANTPGYCKGFSPHICHRYNTFGNRCPYSINNELGVKVMRAWINVMEQENYNKSKVQSTMMQTIRNFHT